MTHADRDGSERELSAYLAADKAEPRRASYGTRVCSVGIAEDWPPRIASIARAVIAPADHEQADKDARAKVARAEALADGWSSHDCSDFAVMCDDSCHYARELRAALAGDA